MILRFAIAVLLPALALRAETSVANKSVSTSGQFAIYANSPSIRSKAAIKAEDFKHEFLELLQIDEDEWKTPVILNLGATPPNTRRPPLYKLGAYEADAGKAKIQLDVFDLDFLNTTEYDAQLLGAIVLEYTYRDTPIAAGRGFEQPPPWLVEGLLEKIHARDNGLKASVYASLLAGGETPRLDQFIDNDPSRLDPTSRALYRAQASAFLDAILELPEGRKGLRQILEKPRKNRGSLNDVLAAFPSLGGERDTLSRKWVLAIAHASAANRVDSLTIRETASQLNEILNVKPLPDPRHPEVAAMSGPYALETIARSQSGNFILTQMSDSLMRLSIRSHPLYKSLVDEYLKIVRELVDKPKKRVDKRVAAAEELRAGLSRQTSEIGDYLDWIEANKLQPDRTDDVVVAIDEVEEIEKPAPRTDAISRYIDAVAERGW